MGPCLRWARRFCATCAPVNLALLVAVAYRGLLLFGIGLVAQKPSSFRDRPCSCRVQRPSFRIGLVAVAYGGLLLFGIGFVARSGFLVIKNRLAFEGIPLVALIYSFHYANAFNFTSQSIHYRTPNKFRAGWNIYACINN